jgi:hypothetical protein
MEDKHLVRYNSKQEYAFNVSLPQKEVKFTRNESRLYVFTPPYITDETRSEVNMMIDSVEENAKNFTERQIKRAKEARQLYHALGSPSVHDFRAIIQTNAIRNLPITLEDIETIEMIFGPDIGALKGKTDRTKSAPVVSNYIEIPKEIIVNHQMVTLCIDAMNINGLTFLKTVSRRILYRTAEFISDQTIHSCKNALDTIFRIYNKAGFTINMTNCDNEFRPIMKDMEDIYNVRMNYVNPY